MEGLYSIVQVHLNDTVKIQCQGYTGKKSDNVNQKVLRKIKNEI